jgi:hypothetical protein
MNDKPRHIRDIAHLYLSRIQKREEARHDHVLVFGSNRKCFPAFHLANLATSMSLTFFRSGSRTGITILEASGILPNTGYYLTLDPLDYLAEHGGTIGALLSIDVKFTTAADPTCTLSPATEVGRRISFIHLPPLSDGKRFLESLAHFEDAIDGGKIFLYVTDGGVESGGMPGRVQELLESPSLSILHVGVPGGGEDTLLGSRRILGHMPSGWRLHVSDRLPVVLRNPGGELATLYESSSEILLYRIGSERRVEGATNRAGSSPGPEAGPEYPRFQGEADIRGYPVEHRKP